MPNWRSAAGSSGASRKHVAILFFGFVILLGGKIIVCAGEMLLLAILFLCAAKTGDGHQG